MTETVLIEPGRGERQYWRDLWRYRELFYFLAWRDILVRYKQTVVGIAWAVIRPFLMMLVMTFIFGHLARLPTFGRAPYPLMVMAGMLPWQFFSTALSESSNSLIGNANLISKIYFPRLIIPAGSVITSFVDFLITLGILAVMMAWYRFVPDWRVFMLPAFMALAFSPIGLCSPAIRVALANEKREVPAGLEYFSVEQFTTRWRAAIDDLFARQADRK